MSSGGGASHITGMLMAGSHSASVSLLQKLLAMDPTIYPAGTISGFFGPLTKAAVQKFQVKYGITTVGGAGYGLVGPLTRAKLVAVFGA